MDLKSALGALAVAMTIAAHVPYLRATLNGTNKPHIFTWIIWTLLTFIAFAGQVAGHAGPGAWVTGVTGPDLCRHHYCGVAARCEKDITRGDGIMFACGLAAVPLWLTTSDPVWAMMLISAIDASAFMPTIRKSWHRPHQENSFMYGFNLPRHVVALCALRHYSLTTTLYPAMLLAMNAITYMILYIRRYRLRPKLIGRFNVPSPAPLSRSPASLSMPR